jgi:hypothetical protein
MFAAFAACCEQPTPARQHDIDLMAEELHGMQSRDHRLPKRLRHHVCIPERERRPKKNI